jgi:peptidyl-prolyl cis-trans isomerase B (cyclophilin B)
MKWLRAVPLLTCAALAACSHRGTAADATDPPAPDSAYTGVPPTYPRAKPVAQAASPAKTAPQPPPPIAFATTAPAPQPPPAETAPTPAPKPTAVATSLPTPAPADNPTPSPAQDSTPVSPPVTPPPSSRPLDESEAREEVVVLETSMGNIVIALNDVAAPRTCGNFRKLVSTGFYNHTLFHRVIPHFMIQGGDPNSRGDDRRTYGLGDPGYTLPAEIKLRNVAGAVAMARLPDASNPQRDSNGSQFYICAADCPSLDGQYTVFGQVIRGMDTVNKIAGAPRDKNDDPTDRIEIQAAIETKQQALEENPR